MTATILYEGNLRCNARHLQSNSVIESDAPTDNRGKGERFSPTDLVCTALGTCIVTTMAIKATDLGIELKDTTIDVKKYMASDPRRVSKIDVIVNFPKNLTIKEEDKMLLQKVGDNCPVIKSLHPDITINSTYHWQ
jgi:putative redox protein